MRLTYLLTPYVRKEHAALNAMCFHSEDTESDEISGAPPLIHIILLVAKLCLLNRWLEADLPTIDMLISQVQLYLFSDRVETEKHIETRAAAFFKKWSTFISYHFTQSEINDLMMAFGIYLDIQRKT